MPFARSPEEQAERWLRVLRLHGEVGIALQALGVSEESLVQVPDSGAGQSSGSVGVPNGDVIVEVSRRAMDVAADRDSAVVTTVELLLAVMDVYGEHFSRVLEAHGTDRDEVLERLGVPAGA